MELWNELSAGSFNKYDHFRVNPAGKGWSQQRPWLQLRLKAHFPASKIFEQKMCRETRISRCPYSLVLPQVDPLKISHLPNWLR